VLLQCILAASADTEAAMDSPQRPWTSPSHRDSYAGMWLDCTATLAKRSLRDLHHRYSEQARTPIRFSRACLCGKPDFAARTCHDKQETRGVWVRGSLSISSLASTGFPRPPGSTPFGPPLARLPWPCCQSDGDLTLLRRRPRPESCDSSWSRVSRLLSLPTAWEMCSGVESSAQGRFPTNFQCELVVPNFLLGIHMPSMVVLSLSTVCDRNGRPSLLCAARKPAGV